ncbi:MAG TPA: oligosaccharide flippase family protein, partial [Gemmatimonadaceae bacterium]|nr:oligosaccharide flippase family protein [Gemmatimonadaceae bacterium]
MSFRNNLIASYASQVYVTVIGIAIMPLYLSYMGAEAYGLVGFFTMLLTWFYLLDLGLTPTMAREMARFRGGATDALAYRRLVRALQVIFVTTAMVGGGVLLAFAGIIARDWLNVRHLPLGEVKLALQMIAAGVALRWMSGLYRGAVSGSEHLVWLGGYNAAIATLRFVGVVPVLILIGATPTIFFLYQLIIAALELAGLVLKTTQLLPPIETGEHVGWSLAPVRQVFRFSLTIAFTSSVWVLVTQVDKLALSKLLPLADYGYFMLAILVASGVTIATLPISAALMPRMARVEAEGDQVSLIKLYRDATQLAATIGVPVAFTLAAFAEQVLWAWTGNPELARSGAPVL